MAMKGPYVFSGRKLEGCYAIVHHYFGGKHTGIQAKIHVYGGPPTPEKKEVIQDGKVIQPFVPMDRGRPIDDFTLTVPYVPGEDPYKTSYDAMATDPRFSSWSKA